MDEGQTEKTGRRNNLSLWSSREPVTQYLSLEKVLFPGRLRCCETGRMRQRADFWSSRNK